MTAARAEGRLFQTPVLWGGWVALLGLQIFAFSGVRSDDAFISYRYGQNLASGAGLVFNPGDRMLGATSPAQMLLSALVYALVGREHCPSVMAALGCIAWSAQSLALFLLLAPSLGRRGATFVALLVSLGGTRAQTWVPLETNFVAACVLFACVAAERGRWHGAAAFAAAATWFRPDAWLTGLILGGFCLWEQRRRVLRPLLVFTAVAAPWPVFATVYYGSPLPQSAVTKFHRSTLGDYFLHELTYPSAIWFPLPVPALQTLVTLSLAAVGAFFLLRRSRRLAPFVLAGVAQAAAYLYLRPFTIHGWHIYPWVLTVCVCAWSALICVAQEDRARGRRAAWLTVAIAALGLLIVQTGRYADSIMHLDSEYWTGQRHAVYRDIARYLDEHARSDDWFGSVEVGTIAYYTNLSAFDFGGLVTRSSQRLDQHPVRFLVVDRLYMQPHTAVRPIFQSQHGDFLAVVYANR